MQNTKAARVFDTLEEPVPSTQARLEFFFFIIFIFTTTETVYLAI